MLLRWARAAIAQDYEGLRAVVAVGGYAILAASYGCNTFEDGAGQLP